MFAKLPSSSGFTVHALGERLKVLSDAGMSQEQGLLYLSEAPMMFS